MKWSLPHPFQRRDVLLTLIGLTLFSFCATAQKRAKFEFKRNLPVYADSLLKDLTYPMAWGNSPITDFAEWRQAARQKVFDCMLTPPPPFTHHPSPFTIIAEEQRDGYRARKIEIRLSRYYTVPAYVLIPDGKGPFPAVNALHDHGAHLFIGKEKMIRPLACEDSTVVKDADEWAANLYEGQFVGDYLARNGYVVFSDYNGTALLNDKNQAFSGIKNVTNVAPASPYVNVNPKQLPNTR